MTKFFLTVAMIIALVMPMAKANAAAPMLITPATVPTGIAGASWPLATAFALGTLVMVLNVEGVDPWTPLAHDLYGAQGEVDHTYPNIADRYSR